MKKTLSIIFTLLILAEFSFAQVEKGDKELQFTGSFYKTTGTDISISAGQIAFKLGRYVSDHLELGVAPTISITSSPTFDPVTFEIDNETTATFGVGIFGTYSFLSEDAKTMPYLGIQWFTPDLGGMDDGTGTIVLQNFFGINAGIKVFVTEEINIDIGGNYLAGIGSNTEGGTLLFQIGLGIILPNILN